MTRYRKQLPQLAGDIFLTDGGTETDLIYSRGFELPCFASFHLLNDDAGYAAIKDYYRKHAEVASRYKVGFILDSLTYRASADWAEELGYSSLELAEMNHKAIELLRDVGREYESNSSKMVLSGCLGPREDAYLPTGNMTADESEQYHIEQIKTLDAAGVDMISALTLNEVDEAIGITRAAISVGIPVVISFSLETDGSLLKGGLLKDAISQIDRATDNGPVYYMINCAHPTHFEHILNNESWGQRIRGIRANASCKSHAELWQSEILEDGDPIELGEQYADLASRFEPLNVFGGCCGTNHQHLEAICKSVLQSRNPVVH
ncbi:MAG: S-methylmethionine-dependent homocysteine/selenocysteine methylase [Planctomycetota bacterium]|jgi:S-methylmethionine-dependent homocysteine/selenocysteine methylase